MAHFSRRWMGFGMGLSKHVYLLSYFLKVASRSLKLGALGVIELTHWFRTIEMTIEYKSNNRIACQETWFTNIFFTPWLLQYKNFFFKFRRILCHSDITSAHLLISENEKISFFRNSADVLSHWHNIRTSADFGKREDFIFSKFVGSYVTVT